MARDTVFRFLECGDGSSDLGRGHANTRKFPRHDSFMWTILGEISSTDVKNKMRYTKVLVHRGEGGADLALNSFKNLMFRYFSFRKDSKNKQSPGICWVLRQPL